MGFMFEPFVALRYLRSKRREVFISIITVISVLGVAVSVLVLDMVMAIMTGFERELQDKLISANAHIVVRRYGGDISGWEELVPKITAVKGVKSIFPYTYNQAMLATDAGARGVIIRGVADSEVARSKILELITVGNKDTLFSNAPVIVTRPDGTSDSVELPPLVLGQELVQRLGLLMGEPVTMFSPQLAASPQGLMPRLKRFVPTGVYSSGLVEYEAGIAYTSLEQAQRFFRLGNQITGLEIVVSKVQDAPAIGKAIEKALSGEPVLYYSTDWTEQNQALWEAIRLEKKVYFIVLLLLVLVASFSIVSTLVMVVMEKSKDIAIFKSIGATDGMIMRAFLLQGIIIGAVGTVLGTILGYAGCILLRTYGFEIDRSVFSLDQVPVHMDPFNFLTVAIAGFLITALAGLYPAWRAARLEPADAFRFE